MYKAFEYIDVNGTRRVGISKEKPTHPHHRILKQGSLKACKSYLYPNGDADDEIIASVVPFLPKY
jgi:hypothetical protein